MGKDRETSKLGAEELSKRVAPISTPVFVPTDPVDDPVVGDSGVPTQSVADQPGNSDMHRDKPFWKTEP